MTNYLVVDLQSFLILLLAVVFFIPYNGAQKVLSVNNCCIGSNFLFDVNDYIININERLKRLGSVMMTHCVAKLTHFLQKIRVFHLVFECFRAMLVPRREVLNNFPS